MQTVERFRELIPIANASGNEAYIRQYIQEVLYSLQFDDQKVDEAGNLFVRIPGDPDKETLLLSAHMDSVSPCEGIESVEENRENRRIIRSAGRTILGADDKSGIAVILSVVERLHHQESHNHAPLELLFSAEEEIGLLGLKAFDLRQCQARMGYVLDGEGNLGDIFYSGPTQKNMLFTLQGIASHAGIAPEAGVSAIEMAAHLCSSLPSGRLNPETTMNIGTIEGGEALNIVASSATIRAEIRSHNEAALAGLLDQIEEICHEIEDHFPGGQVTLTINHRYSRFEVDPGHPVVVTLKAACQALGIEPKVLRMNIGSDAHVLNDRGISAVVLGMGFHFSHSLKEFIDLDELEQVTQLVWRRIHS